MISSTGQVCPNRYGVNFSSANSVPTVIRITGPLAARTS
jgi:hypothetical protein